MILLTWILLALLIIAVVYVAVEKLISRLKKHGGFTIRIEAEDDYE